MLIFTTLASYVFTGLLSLANWNFLRPGTAHFSCSEVTFPISLSSQSLLFASPPDADNSTAIVDFMAEVYWGNPPAVSGTTTVTGDYSISATYCLPSSPSKHHHHTPPPTSLQILIHGVTYNKTIWSGLGFRPQSLYSWHHHATARGYATLAIDRLGHGLSSRPDDTLLQVQPQAHVDILHAIISAARGSSSSPPSPSPSPSPTPHHHHHHHHHPVFQSHQYKAITLVSHSYGTLISAALTNQHPLDAEALVLTGFSTTADFNPVARMKWDSASNIHPARYAGFPKGYVTLSDRAEREEAYYAPVGGYDPRIPVVDFTYEDTVTVGEIGGLASVFRPVVGFEGKVMVVVGDGDGFFCPKEKVEREGEGEAKGEGEVRIGLGMGMGSCEEILEKTKEFFPDAEEYGFVVAREAGHDFMLHYSAAETAGKVLDWLDERV